MSGQPLDLQQRVKTALAVGRYVRAAKRFQSALAETSEASVELQQQIGADQRFVTQVDYRHFLVNSDQFGNFSVEEIDVM